MVTPPPDLSWVAKFKEIIVALIAVVGTVVGVVIPYLFQKNRELKLRVVEQKARAYTRFLRNFTEIAVAAMHDDDERLSGMEADRERMRARDQLLLFGSDDVIRAYDAWVRYADIEDHDLTKEGELVSLIFLAIRKDLLGSTRVTEKHLENMNPFNRG